MFVFNLNSMSVIAVPHTIKWNEIKLQDTWLLEDTMPDIPPKQRELDQILQSGWRCRN